MTDSNRPGEVGEEARRRLLPAKSLSMLLREIAHPGGRAVLERIRALNRGSTTCSRKGRRDPN